MNTELRKMHFQKEEETPLAWKKKSNKFGEVVLTIVIGPICALIWLIHVKYFLSWEYVNGWPINFKFSFGNCTYYIAIAVALAVAGFPEGLTATCLALATHKNAQLPSASSTPYNDLMGMGCENLEQMDELAHLKIPLQAIKNSTQDFSETNFIGKGGYGRVYKGILSWDGYQDRPVAVKQLDVKGFQGQKEFYTEVVMLSQYRHENIVTLIGFCDDSNEMILVYEYASNGSLDTYLSDPTMLGQLSLRKRLDICVGAASALDYLHNHVADKHRIIHRDMKSANILLDENWNAKLSDFGLSKICLANQQNTFVVTNLAGTHGYCDPQYETTGILTKESDLYSFGVVLFEVLCGRLAYVPTYHDERLFLHHLARTFYENGEIGKIIDHRIRDHIMPKTLSVFSNIAYRCLHKIRKGQPTIAEVVLTLENARRVQNGAEIIKTFNLPPSAFGNDAASGIINERQQLWGHHK